MNNNLLIEQLHTMIFRHFYLSTTFKNVCAFENINVHF